MARKPSRLPESMTIFSFWETLKSSFPKVNEIELNRLLQEAFYELGQVHEHYSWQDLLDFIELKLLPAQLETLPADDADLWVEWAEAFAVKWSLSDIARQQLRDRLARVSRLFERISELENRTKELENNIATNKPLFDF